MITAARFRGPLINPPGGACWGAMVPKKIEAEAVLENCRALINRIGAGLSVGRALRECLMGGRASVCTLSLPLRHSRRPHHAPESVGRRKSPSIITDAPARLRTLHRAEDIGSVLGRRKSLPATTCQRSARASFCADRSQFWPRGCDTYSAPLPQRPSRSHLGYQIHQTYYLPTSSEPPPPPSVAWCAHQVQSFDLSQTLWCRGLWRPWLQGANFWRR